MPATSSEAGLRPRDCGGVVMGQALRMPIAEGKFVLGEWQQIFHLERDVKPRDREIVITVQGE